MKMTPLLLGFLVLLMLGTDAAASSYDFAAYWPNYSYAATYDLIGVDTVTGANFRLRFYFPAPLVAGELPTAWGRSFDYDHKPCNQDWQTWTGDGLYWNGLIFDCAGSSLWSSLPPVWPRDVVVNDDQTTATVLGSSRIAFVRMLEPLGSASLVGPEQWTITAQKTATGFTIRSQNETTGAYEQWWFACVPVSGGDCAPGLSRVVVFDGAAVDMDATYSTWVPR